MPSVINAVRTTPLLAVGQSKAKLLAISLVVVAAAEWIGTAKMGFGAAKVVLLPMLWALLIAAALGIAQRHVPAALRITPSLQSYASSLLNAGILLFIIKLGLTVGAGLPAVRESGWALMFQEFGHALGTLAIGLPLALLLGIKREAIGATFSIGREGNLVIIGAKYGMASAEGRGVLAEYITGTVLGALFIAVLAGFVAGLNIFHARSLAMGAGVGSGSMMAAAIGAILVQQPAEIQAQLTAIAAASNLLTSVLGFYFTLFLSLPLCAWLYAKLEPVLGRFSTRAATESLLTTASPSAEPATATTASDLPFGDTVIAWALMTGGVMIGNLLSYKVPLLQSLLGMSVVVAVALVVMGIRYALPKMPLVLVLSMVATVAGIPDLLPFSNAMIGAAAKLNFLAFTTPVLAMAGFSVAKDLPFFRRLGWRIVLVSLTATTGSFLGAALIAELFN